MESLAGKYAPHPCRGGGEVLVGEVTASIGVL